MDCIYVNLKNAGPPFFKFISVYIKVLFTQLKNHSQLLIVAVILQMKESCSANLTFRAHTM